MEENKNYLNKQLITYLGNKRKLLNNIEKQVVKIQKKLKKNKTKNADLFAGSGSVSRLLKGYSSILISNDLEKYSYVINKAYLTNKDEIDLHDYETSIEKLEKFKNNYLSSKHVGKFEAEYAPENDKNIRENERAFFTKKNARILDGYRTGLDALNINGKIRDLITAQLLSEMSKKNNTAGVFKGFYKDKFTKKGKFGGTGENSLERITADISLENIYLSNFSSHVEVFNEDAVKLSKKIASKDLDIVYIDPPYNQHPYGSNYFMLNNFIDYDFDKKAKSKVAGIVEGWNRSNFNKKSEALSELEEIVKNLNTKYFIISYSSDGFIPEDQMKKMLNKYGKLEIVKIPYERYKASRNYKQINKKEVKEYLYILRKCKKK